MSYHDDHRRMEPILEKAREKLEFLVKYEKYKLSEAAMEYLHIRKTDLTRNTRQVLRQVQRGQTAIIEGHGQEEAALMDIVDYRLQRAALAFYAQKPGAGGDADLTDEAFASIQDDQKRYDLAIGYYLGEQISLGRLAELLKLPWVDLRMRLARLDIPVLTGPQAIEELRQDIENALVWSKQGEA